jgi:peptide chain release factor subunit 1
MVNTRTRIESPLSGKEAQVAATVSWDGLRELAGFRAEKGCAISVYVDLDPSVAPTAGDAASRVNSLMHEGEVRAESAHELTHDQREALRTDLARIRDFFQRDFDRDGSRGIAVFCAGLDNAWRTLPLGDPVADKIAVGREFYLSPLVPLVGRGDGALVAVVGRERGTVYILRGGRLEELIDQFDETPGRHDQGGWSQARYQRHIETLVHEHLKEVGEQLDRRVRRLQSPRVVLVTTEETRAELEEVLSHEVKNAIVGWTHSEAHAAPTELLQAARPILEEWHAKQEREAAERWHEESGRGARATAGWADTLEAASDGRVELLLFHEGAEHAAWQCPRCGRVSAQGGPCPLDGTQMEERGDGLNLAVHQTLAHGGSVLALRHYQDLDPVEGIGALLRY